MHNHLKKHAHQLHEKELLDVVDSLSRFIMHEVVNVRGKFFHEAQDLAMEDKCVGLREWENLQHSAASSSVRRGE